ncbi:polysaccharide biosynthesis protein [candidate division WOR-3 bacterium]|nr:polysaccharide biosynthesis protein [candidate division WOR-3 bacterium]
MSKREIIISLFDVGIAGLVYYLSFALRFSSFTFPHDFLIFLKTLPIVLLIKFFAFTYFKVYKGIWRYASIKDLLDILKAATISTSIIIFVIFTLSRGEGYPRSVPIIDWFLTVIFIGGLRFSIRIRKERAQPPAPGSKRTLIIGAGDAGIMILKEMKTNPQIGYNPIGFIDDDTTKQGRTIQGIHVLGRQTDIPRLVRQQRIAEIIIAIPSASGDEMREIVKQCEVSGVKFKTLPVLGDVINGTVSISQIKDVDVSDLLRREPIELDTEFISRHLSGKRIMVTGAGGSIGSELCRQIAKFNPQELILLDMAETPLFFIELFFRQKFPNLKITSFLSDVKDSLRLEEIIKSTSPQIIYHAAAYKHVPVLEKNILEGIKNNIFGTKTLADLASQYGVEEFVMVSTDKAVNPKSFMGISKRINEIYIQSLSEESGTKFVSVRFGNVLDSSGSCVPIFKHQIKAWEPITITHRDAKRYFMTLPEAGQLIIQAGAMGQGGEIFILKMGEPINVLNLAQDLVTLSGIPKENVKFSFTGLRPGEKLEEELIGKGEKVQVTSDEKILIVKSSNHIPLSKLNKDFIELKQYVASQDTSLILKKCKSIVSNYS